MRCKKPSGSGSRRKNWIPSSGVKHLRADVELYPEERRHSRHAVCVSQNPVRDDGDARQCKRRHVHEARPGDEHHEEAYAPDDHDGAVVGLKEDRHRDDADEHRGP